MASSLIGSLRVALGLDTAQFESGANKAAQIARQKAGQMETSFKGVKTAVEGLFAAFTVGLIADQIKKSLDYAGSLAEVSKTLGVTTKDLQEFRFAATQTGVSQDVLEKGLRKLTVTIGQMKEGAEAPKKALEALQKGLSDQVKAAPNTGDAFRLISDALSKVTDRSQRAGVEAALMSARLGPQLDNMLAPGAKRLNELGQAVEALGGVLSDEQIQNSEETAHKLEQVKMVLSAQIAGVVSDNASAIASFAGSLAKLTSEIIRFMSTNPQVVLGILGGLVGLRLGGLGGALAGGLGGILLGANIQQQNLATSMDIGIRKQAVRDALEARRKVLSGPSTSTFMQNGIPITIQNDKTKEINAANNALQHQVDMLNQAYAAQKAAQAPTPPGVDVGQFLAGKPPKPKKGPTDRSEDVEFAFEQQLRQTDMEILRYKQQLEGSAEDRAKLDLQMIALEHEMAQAEIDHKVSVAQRDFAEGKITKAALDQVTVEADILRAKNDEKTQIELQAYAEEQARKKRDAIFQIDDERRGFAIDALKSEDELARTAADHKKIQLEILDAEIEQKRLQLEKNKLDATRNGATKEEIAAIQAQIDNLPNQRAQQAASINHNNMSPLQAYFDSIPKNAQEIGAALETSGVKALEDFNDQLANAIVNAKSLKDALHSVFTSLLQDLIKLAMQEAELQIFKMIMGGAGSLGGGISGASDFSGSFGAVSSGVDFSSIPVTGFATGGSFRIRGIGGTDKNLLSLNGLPIAKVGANERININAANDGGPMMPPLSLAFHNDFRGADPAAVASISDKLDRLKAAIPSMAVGAWIDAQQRFVVK